MASYALPSPTEPFVDPQTGQIRDIWYRYLFQNKTATDTVAATTTFSGITGDAVGVTSTFTATGVANFEGASAETTIGIARVNVGVSTPTTSGTPRISFENPASTVQSIWQIDNNANTMRFFIPGQEIVHISTGSIAILPGVNTVAGGTANQGLTFGSTGIGIVWGSGAPTTVAVKGSLYLRTDGASSLSRAYINTAGTSVWTAIQTVA